MCNIYSTSQIWSEIRVNSGLIFGKMPKSNSEDIVLIIVNPVTTSIGSNGIHLKTDGFSVGGGVSLEGDMQNEQFRRQIPHPYGEADESNIR